MTMSMGALMMSMIPTFKVLLKTIAALITLTKIEFFDT